VESIYLIMFFILGLVFGSFYNVVGFRLCNKESLVKPRSHCPKCNHVLKAGELIPVISYIIQGGRCRKCKAKISVFYPMIELFTGLLFSISYYSFGFSYDLLMALTLSSMFVIIVVTDLNYYIIPDEINIFFAVLIFIINILKFGFLGACKYLVFGAIMFLFMYLLMNFGNILFKEESLGGGDVKLIFALGMVMTPSISFVSIALSAFIALPASLIIYFINKERKLPYGPFLVLAFLLVYFLKIDIQTVYDLIKLI